MACASSCKTQDHESFGACIRAQGQMVAYCGIGNGDATVQKKWDRSLDRYRAARAEGIQPSSTRPDAVRRAVEASDATGKAFVA